MDAIMRNDLDLDLQTKKQEYLDYIEEHINNVIMMFNKLFVPIQEIPVNDLFNQEEFDNAMQLLSESIKDHDQSKYSEEEFEPYRRHFFPTKAEEESDDKSSYDDFRNAWHHHYTNNPHHPKYWIDLNTGVATDMSLGAIIEMICDWEAMSYKFKDNTIEWYETKADGEKKAMTDKTRAITEFILYNLLNS